VPDYSLVRKRLIPPAAHAPSRLAAGKEKMVDSVAELPYGAAGKSRKRKDVTQVKTCTGVLGRDTVEIFVCIHGILSGSNRNIVLARSFQNKNASSLSDGRWG
jgi:hypothetical protein